MLSNAYFLAKFRFDTAENEPAKNLQNFRKCIFEKCIFRLQGFVRAEGGQPFTVLRLLHRRRCALLARSAQRGREQSFLMFGQGTSVFGFGLLIGRKVEARCGVQFGMLGSVRIYVAVSERNVQCCQDI